MAHPTPLRPVGRFAAARRRFTQAAGLPFADLLPADAVARAVAAEGVRFRDCLFPSAVTPWVFLSQVLDAAHCCRQTPAKARKEVGMRLPAYNPIRGVMARAAGRLPWEASFAGAVRTAAAFAPLAWAADEGEWQVIADRLWAVGAEHRVSDRPGRCEPRAQKRRPQTYPLLNQPRDHARARLTARRCA